MSDDLPTPPDAGALAKIFLWQSVYPTSPDTLRYTWEAVFGRFYEMMKSADPPTRRVLFMILLDVVEKSAPPPITALALTTGVGIIITKQELFIPAPVTQEDKEFENIKDQIQKDTAYARGLLADDYIKDQSGFVEKMWLKMHPLSDINKVISRYFSRLQSTNTLYIQSRANAAFAYLERVMDKMISYYAKKKKDKEPVFQPKLYHEGKLMSTFIFKKNMNKNLAILGDYFERSSTSKSEFKNSLDDYKKKAYTKKIKSQKREAAENKIISRLDQSALVSEFVADTDISQLEFVDDQRDNLMYSMGAIALRYGWDFREVERPSDAIMNYADIFQNRPAFLHFKIVDAKPYFVLAIKTSGKKLIYHTKNVFTTLYGTHSERKNVIDYFENAKKIFLMIKLHDDDVYKYGPPGFLFMLELLGFGFHDVKIYHHICEKLKPYNAILKLASAIEQLHRGADSEKHTNKIKKLKADSKNIGEKI